MGFKMEIKKYLKYNCCMLVLIFILSVFTISILSSSVNATSMIIYSDNKNVLYSSTDGVTFSLMYNASSQIGNNQIIKIATSQDGQYIYFLTKNASSPNFNNYFFRSNDFGNTFNKSYFNTTYSQNGAYYSNDFDTDYSGQYVIMTSGGTTNPSVTYRSTNFGLTFSTVALLSNGVSETGAQVSISNDGTSAIVSTTSNAFRISTNYGSSYTNYINGAIAFGGVCTSDGISYYASQTGGTGQTYVNNGSLVNPFILRGNVISTTSNTLQYVCDGSKALIYNQYTLDNLATHTDITARNNFISNEDLSLVYTFNTNQLLYSTNYGLNFSNQHNATNTITNIAMTPQNFNQSVLHTPLCIDETTLCNNPLGVAPNIYCDVLDFTYCAVNCTNVNITGVLTGVCDNGICTNDCNILGYQDCSNINTFKICGNYDTDACLEYADGYSCNSGDLCSNGYCYTPTYSNSLTNNTAFTVTPYSVSSESTVYTLDTANKKLLVDTKSYVHIQNFAILTTNNNTYSSRTCDYKETSVYTNNVINTIVNSTPYTFTSQGSTSYLELSLLPQDLTTTEIKVLSSTASEIDKIYLIRNSTNKELSIYNSTLGLLYTDISTNTYDDLNKVLITYTFDFSSKTFTRTFTFDRFADNIKSLLPKIFIPNDYSTININSTNTTFNSIAIKTFTQPTTFKNTLRNDYNFLPCTYGSIGCSITRTYNQNSNLPDFTNYYDYNICVNTLNNDNPEETSSTGNFFDGTGLNQGTKYLIVLFAILAVILTFVAIGFMTNTVKVATIFGFIISTFVMIIFTVFGWVPSWILVMLVIVALASSIILGTMKSDSSQG